MFWNKQEMIVRNVVFYVLFSYLKIWDITRMSPVKLQISRLYKSMFIHELVCSLYMSACLIISTTNAWNTHSPSTSANTTHFTSILRATCACDSSQTISDGGSFCKVCSWMKRNYVSFAYPGAPWSILFGCYAMAL